MVMERDAILALARNLLPGFGFFGPFPPFQLRVEVNATIDSLRMFLDSGKPQSFLFPALRLHSFGGEEIPPDQVVEYAEMTSAFPDAVSGDVTRAVLGKERLRSAVEKRPELHVAFRKPVELSHITLMNQRGKLAHRNRDVNLSGYLGGRSAFFFRNATPENLVQEFIGICGELGLAPAECSVEGLREVIAARLDDGGLDWPVHKIAWLLPLNVASNDQPAELTDFQHRVCVNVIDRVLGKRLRVQTAALVPLAPLLSSTQRLEAIIKDVNARLSARHGRPVNVQTGKHVTSEPRLIAEKDAYLDGLERLFPHLDDYGASAMLCYGTLLGAVREQGFLAHDDDVDLLYFDGSRSREEAAARRRELLDYLNARGIPLAGGLERMNFHVKSGKVTLDLFPSWEDGDSLHVMMEGARYRPVPKSIVLPTGSVVLHGRRFRAPANPEAFLADRYGPGWRVPDLYYGWPWRIIDASANSGDGANGTA